MAKSLEEVRRDAVQTANEQRTRQEQEQADRRGTRERSIARTERRKR